MSVSSVAGLLAAGSLLFGLGAPAAAPAKASGPYPMAKYASTSAEDGRLKSGCGYYAYTYRVKPPTEIWGLETTLVDPRGKVIASGAYLSGSNPTTDRVAFRFCRNTTVPGRFKIRAKFSYKSGPGDNATDGSARTSTFYLR